MFTEVADVFEGVTLHLLWSFFTLPSGGLIISLQCFVVLLYCSWEKPPRLFCASSQDVKAGDVLQKKNMWEIIGEGSATGRSGQAGKVHYEFPCCSSYTFFFFFTFLLLFIKCYTSFLFIFRALLVNATSLLWLAMANMRRFPLMMTITVIIQMANRVRNKWIV